MRRRNDGFLKLHSRLLDLGNWIYIKKSNHFDSVLVENGSPQGLYSAKFASLREYVNRSSNDSEELKWLDSFYRRMFQDPVFRNRLNTKCLETHGFSNDDLATVSINLKSLADKKYRFIESGWLRQQLQRQTKSEAAEKLYDSLIFKKGRTLEKSPIIPFQGSGLLIADWVLRLHMHFESYVRPILETPGISGDFGNLIGRTFEQDVIELLRPVVNSVTGNVEVRASQFPVISKYLPKMNKKDKFEIDAVARGDSDAFVISCKGGKKSLPKLSFARMWAEYPESEILSRIEENEEEMQEVLLECECIESESEVAEYLGISNKRVHPLLVYSSLQPLSFQKVRLEFNVHSEVPITTPGRMVETIKLVAKGSSGVEP